MSIERKIGGDVYRFSEVVGWEAFDCLQLLIKVAGPFIPVLEAVDEADESKRTAAIVRALPGILQGHDANSLRTLLDKLMPNCTVGGVPAVVGVKPQTLDEMLQVFSLCLEGQFGPFFGGDGVKSLMSVMGKASSPSAT